jgi:hypothetical protein
MLTKLADTMVSIEGENMRPVTWGSSPVGWWK